MDIETSVETSTGKIQDLPPPPTAQDEVRRSPFRKVFEHSQKVRLNGLLDVGCFQVVDEKDEKDVPKRREYQSVGKLSGSRWAHTYKCDEQENCSKIYSRVVSKGFTQVQDVEYLETTFSTLASAAVKMLAAMANDKDLPGFYLDVYHAFLQAHLKEKNCLRLPRGCGELSGEVVKLLEGQYGLQ